MKKQFKLGIIGCGDRAQTILKGVVLSDFLHEKKIIVSDVSEERLDLAASLGVHATYENQFVAENCEFLVVAVNQENFKAVAQSLNGAKPEKIISIVSGVTKNSVKTEIGVSILKVARCVLNFPCAIGSGVVGVDMSDFNESLADTEFISNVFNCIGTVLSVDESKLNAVSSLSDCGHTFTLALMDALIDAGVKQGLSRDEARIVAVQTVYGAADTAENDNGQMSDLIVKSCKGNSVIEAVKVFEKNNFRGIISEGVEACAKRLKEATEK